MSSRSCLAHTVTPDDSAGFSFWTLGCFHPDRWNVKPRHFPLQQSVKDCSLKRFSIMGSTFPRMCFCVKNVRNVLSSHSDGEYRIKFWKRQHLQKRVSKRSFKGLVQHFWKCANLLSVGWRWLALEMVENS